VLNQIRAILVGIVSETMSSSTYFGCAIRSFVLFIFYLEDSDQDGLGGANVWGSIWLADLFYVILLCSYFSEARCWALEDGNMIRCRVLYKLCMDGWVDGVRLALESSLKRYKAIENRKK
jgi:hypothetical protein